MDGYEATRRIRRWRARGRHADHRHDRVGPRTATGRRAWRRAWTTTCPSPSTPTCWPPPSPGWATECRCHRRNRVSRPGSRSSPPFGAGPKVGSFVGGGAGMAEVEGHVGGTPAPEMGQALLGVGHRREAAGGDPPQRHVGLGHGFEPEAALHHDVAVIGSQHEGPQRRQRLPDRQVDHDALVVEGADGGGVTGFGLQPPDEALGGVGPGVDGIQGGHETGQGRRVDGRLQAADVDLCQVIAVRLHRGPMVPTPRWSPLGSVAVASPARRPAPVNAVDSLDVA